MQMNDEQRGMAFFQAQPANLPGTGIRRVQRPGNTALLIETTPWPGHVISYAQSRLSIACMGAGTKSRRFKRRRSSCRGSFDSTGNISSSRP